MERGNCSWRERGDVDMIRLSGVGKSYAATTALSPVDLSIDRGRTTVLVGASGSGKSTVLRLIIGLARADCGAITFDGEPVDERTIGKLRLRMGYVVQEGGLFPHFTARENIVLVARHLGRTGEGIRKRLGSLVQLTHFPPALLDHYPFQLSGGLRQRVSLMRALFLDPEVLLLDEPLGALDAVTRTSLQKELQEIFRTLAKTVILVTHDLSEAVFFADRLVMMHAGRILQQGAPLEILRAPAADEVGRLVAAYRDSLSPFIEGLS